MSNRILIIYHSEDNDGRVSGVLCRISMAHRFKDSEITCKGYTYAQLSELINKFDSINDFIKSLQCKYDKIILTDISFNESEVMSLLYKEYKDCFYWFDHHIPAVKASFEMGYNEVPGFRVLGTCSAIKCVWEYLFNELYSDADNENIPKLLNTLSAYDSFKWEQHGTTFDFCNYINKGFNVESQCDFEKTYNIIKDLLNNINTTHLNWPTIKEQTLLMNCYTIGKALVDAEVIDNKELIKQWGDCSFTLDNGNKCCVLFNQSHLNSTSFKSLIETDIKHGIVFKRIPYTDNYTISLYNINNKETFNCGEYLKKKYKGGGHTGAAGATIKQSIFNKIMKSKII